VKILLIDIETRPNLGYIWSLWNQNVGLGQVVEVKDTICFAYEWLEDKPRAKGFHAVWHEGGRRAMAKAAWDLLDEADAVIHYNGTRFDVPHLNALFIEEDLGRPSPFKNIDLLATVRKAVGQGVPSKRLAYVTKWLGLTSKIETGGFALWVGVIKEDPKAQARMQRYNENDVKIMRPLYYRLLPWIDGHPNRNLYDPKTDGCARCPAESDKLVKAGFAPTLNGMYQRYRCSACGSYVQESKRSFGTSIKESK